MEKHQQAEFKYSGVANLEAMEHARNYNRFLLNLVRRNLVGKNILDLGAGTGAFALPLHREGIAVTCVEPDSQLRSKLAVNGLLTHIDIAEVPPGSVDCLYSINVLEHIEDDCATLAAMSDRICPGGRVIIYVPAFDILFSKMDELVGHHRRYRRNDLVTKMKDTGFRIDSAIYVDSLGFFAALFYRWIGSDTGIIDPTSVKIYDRLIFPLSRILDRLVFGSFGKNLLVIGTRPQ